MYVPNEAELHRLSQESRLAEMRRDFPMSEMLTVYSHEINDQHYLSHYCALVPKQKVKASLAVTSWEFMHGGGNPGTETRYEKGIEKTKYFRFGSSSGVEPLIIGREFHGIRPDCKEISEEFRLFHNLFHDRKEDRYYKIDDDGNEELIATVEPKLVRIRLKELRQFLAIKEMCLALLFDCREHSIYSLEALGLEGGGGMKVENSMCFGLHYGDLAIGPSRAFSRLLGKRMIAPVPKAKSGLAVFAKISKKLHVDFIIGEDGDGDPVTHTSNPAELSNYFGANPKAPHYLTAVHFRKSVLDKYFQQSSKFEVTDNTLWCGQLWSVTIDNHHADRVVVWLGDLGRDLPYTEQLHWRSHNIVSAGKVSETFFKRQILAQFTDSDRPEHVFQNSYQRFLKTCNERIGRPLLLPLAAEDSHHLLGVRVPATNEQKDFDDLIQSLTKVLIDSLDEKLLNGLIDPSKLLELKGSISRLEAALIARGVTEIEAHIRFLRQLQELRSSGAAHRKGSNYKSIAEKFGVNKKSLKDVLEGILEQAIAFLAFLDAAVMSGALN